mgnify:CR=1 FL=1
MDTKLLNAEIAQLREEFPNGHLIGIMDAARYCGVDYRTLEARKDFPIIRLGKRSVVNLTNFAQFLISTRGRGS